MTISDFQPLVTKRGVKIDLSGRKTMDYHAFRNKTQFIQMNTTCRVHDTGFIGQIHQPNNLGLLVILPMEIDIQNWHMRSSIEKIYNNDDPHE
jgi:hypothetical protein